MAMSNPSDGGPAFPITPMTCATCGSKLHTEPNQGMSLRDWFAGHAPDAPEWFDFDFGEAEPKAPESVGSWAAHGDEITSHRKGTDGYEKVVEYRKKEAFYREAEKAWRRRRELARLSAWRFSYADAMLAAREKKP